MKSGDIMEKFRLYDMHSYDDKIQGEVIRSNDLRDIRTAAHEWKTATHEECELIIQKWSDTYQAYVLHESLL
jgi:hypothetical protein